MSLSQTSLVATERMKLLTALASLTSAPLYVETRPILNTRLLTVSKAFDVARSCAKDDPGQWDAVLEAMPCVRALIADVVAASLEPENAGVKDIRFDIRPSGSNQVTSTTQDAQRSTPARDARAKRRAIAAGITANRDAERLKANENSGSDDQEMPEAHVEAVSQLSFTQVVKHASPLSKRQPTQRPKWQPTTCTAPGVTCANDGSGRPPSKHEMRSDSNLEAKSPSSCLAIRDARPSPKLPKWFPLLCTAPGIFCGDSGTTDDGSANRNADQPVDSAAKREAQPSPKLPKWWSMLCTAPGIPCADSGASNDGSKNDSNDQPPDSTSKREAQPLTLAEASSESEKKLPKWQPTSCTARGMTCGVLGDVAEGGTTADHAGAQGAPSTTERDEKRDHDASAQVWSEPGRSTLTDDEGNAVQIEDDSAFAT